MAYAEKVFKVRDGKKTKQFTWRACYKKPDGSKGTQPGFPTKKTAEDWGTAQEAAIKAGRWIDPELQRATFGEFARKFMKARVKRARTMDTRWRNLEQFILPKWENVPLLSITWFDVDSWQQTLQCDDTKAGHCVSLMSTIMTAAVDAKHLATNPLFGRRRTKATGTAVPRKAKTLTTEQKWAPPETVITLAQRLGPATGIMVLTTAFTGLRWGEAAGLHRDNVLCARRQAHDGGYFECPVIKVVPDVGELSEVELRDEDGNKLGTVLRLEHPKSAKGVRDIDVPPFLEQLLRYHLQDWPHEYVFSTVTGKFWRRGNWGKVIRPAADGRPERESRQGVAHRAAWEPIMPGLDMRALRHTRHVPGPDRRAGRAGVRAGWARAPGHQGRVSAPDRYHEAGTAGRPRRDLPAGDAEPGTEDSVGQS